MTSAPSFPLPQRRGIKTVQSSRFSRAGGATLLVLLATAAASTPAPVRADQPVFCELYAPGHFGNWYEVAGEREMREMLAEAKQWGFTGYGDWFDTLDCVSPFSGDPQYSLGNALWDRKRVHFRTAQSLGLKTDLVITPNHVFRDQLRDDRLAATNHRIIGQLVCPNAPGGWDLIVDNYRNMCAGLASAGVRLDSLTACPYDYGGCACQKCQPWIVTFAKLTMDIYEVARQYHPDVALRFIGWWWTAEEHAQFAEWMDRNAPNLAASIALHIPYGRTSVAQVRLPKNCELHAFVHIGYADQAEPRDLYGRTGPVVAPRRIEATVKKLREQSVTGVVAYSEGIFDDANKVLLAGLWSGKYGSTDDVLLDYARRYFRADDSQAAQWVSWVRPWGTPFDHDAAGARRQLNSFTLNTNEWRWRQWPLKADMFAAHQAIQREKSWTPERLAHAEQFWTAYEGIHRGVYGLGPLRHVLAPSSIGLPWYKSWTEHQRTATTQPAPLRADVTSRPEE